MKNFFKANYIEIIALIAILVGLFLIFEPWDIKGILLTTAQRSLSVLKDSSQSATGWLNELLRNLSVTDLIGLLLVIASVVFIIWRIRLRFQSSPRWRSTECPRCGSPLLRVHRTAMDRIIGKIFLPQSRRYQCSNEDCGWCGLLHYVPTHRRHRTGAEAPPKPDAHISE
jgi:hypothetical protein